MSETQTERETELIVGTIDSIVRKREDTWQVVVKPDGSQYTKNLWTKDGETVQALERLLGEHRYFACNVSYWTNNDGKQVRSLWLDSVSEQEQETRQDASAGSAAPQAQTEGMSKDEWRLKDNAGHRRALIAIAVSALGPVGERSLKDYNEQVQTLVGFWLPGVKAERDDPTGEGIPF